jgi:hypothetical protein
LEICCNRTGQNNIDVILVGGAVVSIYTNGAYKSADLDFVINDFSRKELTRVLNSLGFFQKGRHFKHPDCTHLFLEFATFPAGIGEDYEITPAEFEHEGQKIKIYSPTDCVRDRLASYIHFNAGDCLEQALMVATRQEVNLEKIKTWCIGEKGESQWEDFISRLQEKEKL